MNSTQVGVFEQSNQVCLTCFLQGEETGRFILWNKALVLVTQYKKNKKKPHTCSAPIAALWKRKSVLKSWAISLTRRWNGSFLMSSSVDFWYRRISRRATVPGLQTNKFPIRLRSHNFYFTGNWNLNANECDCTCICGASLLRQWMARFSWQPWWPAAS